MRRLFWAAVLLASGFFWTTPAAAESRLFSGTDEVTFTLNAPFTTLVRQAARSTEPVKGTLVLGNGQEAALDIAPRGFTRRASNICTFPPLKLDFDEPAMTGTLFENQNKLKLVTQCRAQSNYEQMLVREFVVYRLYNEITPLSFRVRPVRVTYHDTDGRREDNTRFAFLVEDAGEVAHRNGLKELKFGARELSSRQIDAPGLVRFSLFQFLIENQDTEYFAGPAGDTCCHNSKLFGPEGATSNLMPAPYDFDFSGMVEAPYATPPQGLKVSGPFVRAYLGHCRANDQIPAQLALLRERRAAMTAVINGEPRLTDASRREMLRVLDEGFAFFDNTRAFDQHVRGRCR